MAWSIESPGLVVESAPDGHPVRRTMEQFRQDMRYIVKQGETGVLPAAGSTTSLPTVEKRLFDRTDMMPAVRANDTTNVWRARHSSYRSKPSRPFTTCTLEGKRFGCRLHD